jgi:hypothetical protein
MFALMFAYYWRKDSSPVAHPMIAGVNAIEDSARREAARRLAQMAPAPALPTSNVGKFSAEMLQSVHQRFRAMLAVRGLITQEAERRILAQQILAMPNSRDLIREILLDPAFAKEAFGTFQAEARFYAITVLSEAAQQGDIDFVVNTAAELGEQLAALAEEPDPGRSEDLMGVTAVIGRSLGSQGLQDRNSPVLAKLGFTADMPMPVRTLYIRGLFQGVWKTDGLKEAQAVVERLQML